MPIKPRKVIDFNDPKVSKIGLPAPPWLVNYADLMTETVCFFVILYALGAALNKETKNAAEKIKELMKKENVKVEVKVTKEGTYINLEEQEGKAYFESGRADLTESGIRVLEQVAPIIMALPNNIVIEGHTDNRPMSSAQFASNWELSTSRATNVVKYLVTERSFPPQRLSAVGYGEYRPIAPNDTEENMMRNRRVAIFIKNAEPEFHKEKKE